MLLATFCRFFFSVCSKQKRRVKQAVKSVIGRHRGCRKSITPSDRPTTAFIFVNKVFVVIVFATEVVTVSRAAAAFPAIGRREVAIEQQMEKTRRACRRDDYGAGFARGLCDEQIAVWTGVPKSRRMDGVDLDGRVVLNNPSLGASDSLGHMTHAADLLRGPDFFMEQYFLL